MDLRFVKANPAFYKYTGIRRDIEDQTVQELARAEGVPVSDDLFDILAKVAETGEPSRFEKKSERSQRFYDVYAFPLGPKRSDRVAVLFEDISDRKKHELVNARLGAIVNSS